MDASSPGRGRGRGRAPRQWSESQRDLFLELLEKREGGLGVRELCDEVVYRWLSGVSGIPARQVLRALRTWARPERIGSRRVSRQLARELLAEFPPRTAAELLEPLTDALSYGEPLDLSAITLPSEDPPPLDREGVLADVADDLRLMVDDDETDFQYQDAEKHAAEWLKKTPALFRAPSALRIADLGLLRRLRGLVAGIAQLGDANESALADVHRDLAAWLTAYRAASAEGACRLVLGELGGVGFVG